MDNIPQANKQTDRQTDKQTHKQLAGKKHQPDKRQAQAINVITTEIERQLERHKQQETTTANDYYM